MFLNKFQLFEGSLTPVLRVFFISSKFEILSYDLKEVEKFVLLNLMKEGFTQF